MAAYVRTAILETPLDVLELASEVAADENGALNLFLGVTRNHHEQRAVTGLEYTCYLPMAERVLRELAHAIAEEFELSRLVVLHRIGAVPIGAVSLAVSAGAHHRHQVLEGTLEFVNRLKRDVPIWKREYFADGSVGWVEGAKIEPAGGAGANPAPFPTQAK